MALLKSLSIKDFIKMFKYTVLNYIVDISEEMPRNVPVLCVHMCVCVIARSRVCMFV